MTNDRMTKAAGGGAYTRVPMVVFSRSKLLFRNLRYFRAANLAVIAGMAVATAVLTGALMVGDSVRGSLRELAERRMGEFDHAMVSPRFVPETLGERIARRAGFAERFSAIVPGVVLRGGVAKEGAKGRGAGVQIGALGGKAYGGAAGRGGGDGGPAGAPGGGANGPLRFSLPAPDDAPREAALARRGRNDTIRTFSVNSASVAAAGSFQDLFNLTGGQRQGASAWVNLAGLQDELEQSGQVNLF